MSKAPKNLTREQARKILLDNGWVQNKAPGIKSGQWRQAGTDDNWQPLSEVVKRVVENLKGE